MKTTLDFPDDLYRQVKATAALRGQSMKAFVTLAVSKELAAGKNQVQPRPDYAAQLEAFAERVAAEAPGTYSAGEELSKMRDR